MPNEIIFRSVSELAQKIRERKISSEDAVDAHLKHIAKHNPALNAIVTLNESRARQKAKEADDALKHGETWGQLHGVPITIKDSLETEGLRTTSSYKPLADYIPRQDAAVVARLRAEGAIILGKTNMPMLAGDIQTNSPLFGVANNPWDLFRTPGGSTGGGAAAVAAGLSPLEIGSDIGGSIRIPSHFCGVFGLKPSEHRIPLTGHIPEPPGAPKGVRHMAVIGPLARSVNDLRLAFSIIAGPDNCEWEVPPVPLPSPPMLSLKEYRFAWTDDFGGLQVTGETKAALANLANVLKERGCHVEKCGPPDFDFQNAWYTYGEVYGGEVGSTMPSIPRFLSSMQFIRWRKHSPIIQGALRGLELNMTAYIKALTKRDGFIAALESFLEPWDGWLCPVTATPAFPHCKTGKPINVDGKGTPYFMAAMGYTSIFNLTGHPVVVLPLAMSGENLPIGIQVVGRRWREMELLNAAEALTEVTGPFRRPAGFTV
jgi:amidase